MKEQETLIKRCKKCGKPIDDFDYRWYGGVCESCKDKSINKSIIKVTLTFGLIGFIIFTFIGHIQYNYELDKCANLKSIESAYDFTNKIEIDAEFNSHCYYLRNHPLAILQYYFLSGLLGALLFAIPGGVIGIFKSLTK